MEDGLNARVRVTQDTFERCEAAIADVMHSFQDRCKAGDYGEGAVDMGMVTGLHLGLLLSANRNMAIGMSFLDSCGIDTAALAEHLKQSNPAEIADTKDAFNHCFGEDTADKNENGP